MLGTIEGGRGELPENGWQSTRATTVKLKGLMVWMERRGIRSFVIMALFSARPMIPPYTSTEFIPHEAKRCRRAEALAMESGSGLVCVAISTLRLFCTNLCNRSMVSSIGRYPDALLGHRAVSPRCLRLLLHDLQLGTGGSLRFIAPLHTLHLLKDHIFHLSASLTTFPYRRSYSNSPAR